MKHYGLSFYQIKNFNWGISILSRHIIKIHLDSPSEGEVMQLVGDFKLEEVVHGEEVEHPAVHPSLKEGVLVLGQPHIVQPACHPLQQIV